MNHYFVMIKKYQITVTVSKDLIEWIDQEIENTSKFSSRSHAVEFALKALRNQK